MSHPTEAAAITVLLVDDQRFVGAAIGQLLASEPDIMLHCCLQAAGALAQADAVRPSVILQDLVLPDTDGLTMVRLFREHASTSATPVIVLSANDDAATRAGALAAGAVDYLVKLPGREALVACIRRHAGGRADTAAAPATVIATENTLSLGVLDELKQADHTLPDFAGLLIDQFVAEAASQVAQLNDARLRHDTGAIKATAHSLKGSSMTMGARRLAALCAQLEQQTGGDEVTPAMMADVDLEFIKVRAALAVERQCVAS